MMEKEFKGEMIYREDVRKEIDGFKDWLEQFNLTETSERIYIYVVRKFLEDGYDVWSNESVNRFLKKYGNPNYRAAIKWYLKYKGIRDYELVRPALRRKKIRKIVSLEELAKYVEFLKSRDKEVYWVYRMALVTGARIHEILNLKLKDVDTGDNYIIFRKTKTGDERRVWIDRKVMDELLWYLKEDKGLLAEDRCFFTNWKPKYAYVEIRERIENLLPKNVAKIFLRTHNFRRAVINHLLKLTGGKIMVVKAFIGHKSIQSTERYVAELTEEEMAKEASKILFEGKFNSIGVGEKNRKHMETISERESRGDMGFIRR